jgi:hypothetical protein
MKLDFQLGNGLELLPNTTPKTLQVKSNLDFLTNVVIDGYLDMNGNLNINGVSEINNLGGMTNPLMKIKYSNSDRLKYFTNLTENNFNGIIESEDSAMIIDNKPLSIAYNHTEITSGIRIDYNQVNLYGDSTNYYNLISNIGHNFYGNCKFNNNVTFTDNITANSLTITPAQLSCISGATSSIQTQLDVKASLSENNAFTGTNSFSNTTTFTGNVYANNTTITPEQLSYVSGATSSIQTQLSGKASSSDLNGKASLSGNNAFTGTNTFSGNVNVDGNLTASNIGTITNFPMKTDFSTIDGKNFGYYYVNSSLSQPIATGTYIFEWIIYLQPYNSDVYLAQLICKLDFSSQNVAFNSPQYSKPYNNVASFSPKQINIIPNQTILGGYPFTMSATQVCDLTSPVYPYLYFYIDINKPLTYYSTNSMLKATKIK